jgi:hypothetical protein
MSKSRSLLIVASATVLALSAAAHATTISFSASGSQGGDALGAEATFTTGLGVIDVTLTNTLAPSQIISAGSALSDISFTLSNAPGTQGTLTASGQLGNLAGAPNGPKMVTFTGGSPVRFIGMGPPPPNGTGTFTVNGNTILMEALGGGQPSEMILPFVASGGTFPNANNSLTNFNPSTIGPASFVLDFSGVMTNTTITGATFSFGTGPDHFITGVPVPAPLIGHGLLALLAIGGVLFGGNLVGNLKKYRSRVA